MSIRVLMGTVVIVGLALMPPAAGQGPGLSAGTVTAKIDGRPFSANVSVAVMDESKLVLTNLGNLVQLQVPNAKVGKFEIKLDEDGGLVGVILGLKDRKRYITPVSGSVSIEVLDRTKASGRFEFTGKDLATEAPVEVTGGRFEVKLIARP